MASEPPDTPLDDELPLSPEPSGRRVFGRSCVTLLAAVGVASALMVGCTALVTTKIGDAELHLFDWDLSGLGPQLGCDMWLREEDTGRQELALQVLADASKQDRTLAQALFTGPEAVSLWCISRGYG